MSDLFEKNDNGRLGKSMAYLSWHHLAGAVLDVFRENEAGEAVRGLKANADVWAVSSELRHEIWQRVRRKWCDRSGLDMTWWPFSEDAVARLYFRFRKRNADEIDGFAQEIESASR